MKKSGRRVKVLHLEDDVTDALQFSRTAEKHSVHELIITHALTMSAALNALKHRKFDLLVCDLDLPDSVSAETTLHRVRQLSNLPMIVLTGLEGRDVDSMVKRANGVRVSKDAGRYLPETFAPRALARAVDAAVEEALSGSGMGATAPAEDAL